MCLDKLASKNSAAETSCTALLNRCLHPLHCMKHCDIVFPHRASLTAGDCLSKCSCAARRHSPASAVRGGAGSTQACVCFDGLRIPGGYDSAMRIADYSIGLSIVIALLFAAIHCGLAYFLRAALQIDVTRTWGAPAPGPMTLLLMNASAFGCRCGRFVSVRGVVRRRAAAASGPSWSLKARTMRCRPALSSPGACTARHVIRMRYIRCPHWPARIT